jgi:hypothetical protein
MKMNNTLKNTKTAVQRINDEINEAFARLLVEAAERINEDYPDSDQLCIDLPTFEAGIKFGMYFFSSAMRSFILNLCLKKDNASFILKLIDDHDKKLDAYIDHHFEQFRMYNEAAND